MALACDWCGGRVPDTDVFVLSFCSPECDRDHLDQYDDGPWDALPGDVDSLGDE
jgi:hypothetical protein